MIYQKKGFTLVEILIVLSILGVIAGIVISGFYEYQKRNAIEFTAARVIGLLEHARNLTLASKSNDRYGVHFSSTEAVFFEGTTYSASGTENRSVTFGQGITMTGINLNGGGSDVVFDRLTGGTSHYGTTTLSITASTTQTIDIVIHKTGLIEQQ